MLGWRRISENNCVVPITLTGKTTGTYLVPLCIRLMKLSWVTDVVGDTLVQLG